MAIERSACERQQSHKSGAFDRCLDFPLTTGTVTAALTRKDLPSMRQKFLQRVDILVIDVLGSFTAETTLSLLANPAESLLSFARFVLSHISHILPATQIIYYKINH